MRPEPGPNSGLVSSHVASPRTQVLGIATLCGPHGAYLQRNRYDISTFFSIPEKAALSTEILVSPLDTPIPILSISYMSASTIPLALPPIIAHGFGWPKWGLGFEGVNDRVGKWLLEQLSSGDANRQHLTEADDARLALHGEAGPRIRGWALMDYYEDPIDAEVVPLFVECNFRGRRAGEEGW